jgi:hypothetical protein
MSYPTDFPTNIPVFALPQPTEYMDIVAHAQQHEKADSEIIQLATKMGTGASTPVANSVLAGNGVGTSAYTTDPTLGSLTIVNGIILSSYAAHKLLVSAGSSAVVGITPNATSGIPLISKGSSADPDYGTAIVAGGGTGVTTIGAHGAMIGQGTSPVTTVAPGASGNVLQSDGTDWISGASVGGPPTGTAGGDLTGTYPNPAVGIAGKANLLTNGGFEIWQRGTSFSSPANGAYEADRWSSAHTGTPTITTIAQEATVVDTGSRFAALATLGSGGIDTLPGAGVHTIPSNFVGLQQKVEDFYQVRGQTVSLSMRVRCTVAGTVALAIYDGTNFTWGATQTLVAGAYTTLTLTVTLGASISQLIANVWFGTPSCSYYIDNAMLVVGSTSVAYVPLTIADEMNRCQRYYELASGQVGSETPFIAQASSATTAVFTWRFKVLKAVAPTITIINATSWNMLTATTATALAWSSASTFTSSVHAAGVSVTCATGLVAGNASLVQSSNTNAQITAEANP